MDSRIRKESYHGPRGSEIYIVQENLCPCCEQYYAHSVLYLSVSEYLDFWDDYTYTPNNVPVSFHNYSVEEFKHRWPILHDRLEIV